MATKKLVGLDIGETSGVDHPAHLEEGWLLMKSAGPDLGAVLEDLLKAATEDCPNCGEGVPNGDAKCPHCGAAMPFGGKKASPFSSEDGGATKKSATVVERLVSLRDSLDAAITKATPEGGTMPKDTKAAIPEAVQEFLAKSEAPQNIVDAITALAKGTEGAAAQGTDEDALLKSVDPEVREYLLKERAERETLRKELDDRIEAEEVAKAVAKASTWAHIPGLKAEEFGPVFRSLPEEAQTAVAAALDAAERVASESSLFTELGKSFGSGATGDKLEAMTKERMAKDASLSYEQAQAEVLETAEGARAYAEGKAEKEGAH